MTELFSGDVEKVSQKPTSYGILVSGQWINGKGKCPHEQGDTVHVYAEKNKQGFFWVEEDTHQEKVFREVDSEKAKPKTKNEENSFVSGVSEAGGKNEEIKPDQMTEALISLASDLRRIREIYEKDNT